MQPRQPKFNNGAILQIVYVKLVVKATSTDKYRVIMDIKKQWLIVMISKT